MTDPMREPTSLAAPTDVSKNTNGAATKKNPESWTELGKTAMIAFLLALLIRSFLYEPFNIPSGSMMPTLLVGDYLFVDKRDYGYSTYSFPFGIIPIQDRIWTKQMPEPGDIIVFKLPTDPSIDYIKRVVGLPGDTIQTINGRLYINNKIVPREPVGYERIDNGRGGYVTVTKYIETLPNGVMHTIYEQGDTEELDNAGPFTVPADHYFAMGDNRDNSRDSRVQSLVGFIPFKNIVGRANIIFFSTNGTAKLFEVWKWPFTIRYDRILDGLTPDATAP